MNDPLKIFLLYLGVISILAVIICLYDKLFSKLNNVSFRVPESSLLLISALGGSVAMFLCMLIFRHKTKHAKFTLGRCHS